MSWVSENCERMKSIASARIRETVVIEMALFEGQRNHPPIFWHPGVPFIQAHLIDLCLEDGRISRFATYQNNATFGICMDFVMASTCEVSIDGWSPGYRVAPDLNFPVGVISDVKIKLDEEGDITEITFEVGGQKLLMKAGEVCEHNGGFSVASQDESILLFLNADDVRKVPFDQIWSAV
jgi:hypothetical protein